MDRLLTPALVVDRSRKRPASNSSANWCRGSRSQSRAARIGVIVLRHRDRTIERRGEHLVEPRSCRQRASSRDPAGRYCVRSGRRSRPARRAARRAFRVSAPALQADAACCNGSPAASRVGIVNAGAHRARRAPRS